MGKETQWFRSTALVLCKEKTACTEGACHEPVTYRRYKKSITGNLSVEPQLISQNKTKKELPGHWKWGISGFPYKILSCVDYVFLQSLGMLGLLTVSL